MIADTIYKKHFKRRIKRRNFLALDNKNTKSKWLKTSAVVNNIDFDDMDEQFDEVDLIPEKEWFETLVPISKWFMNTLITNHPIINMINDSARMFPKHSKFNMLMMTLIQVSFLNALWFNAAGNQGCGNPDMPFSEKIQNSIVNMVATSVMSMPIMVNIGKMLRVPEK